LDWSTCVDNPGKWAIDDIFPLQAKSDKLKALFKRNSSPLTNYGDIYLKMRFLDPGRIDISKDPGELKEDIEKKVEIIDGHFSIVLVHGNNLIAADSKTSDPYVEFVFPDQKSVNSKTIQKTLNPIWKERITKQIKMPKPENMDEL